LLIVDDHDLARAGLRSIFASESQLEVVGEAASGREALVLSRRLRPDVVIMDVHMPDLDGLAATRALKQEQPHIHVIMITMHENPDYLREALRAGVSGYVLKGATKQTIVGTVRLAMRGKVALQPELAVQLLRQMAVEMDGPGARGAPRLTARELEIMRLLTRGRTNSEISRELHVSISTVKAHVEHIFAKLDVSDRTQAAVRALELRLLSDAPG
jgi:DNA-binding NarL/FixJ family response regulator